MKEQPIKSTILIIDDNKDFLEIFSLKLMNAGFEVFTASSGADGVSQVRRIRPDLVLLDVEMPDMNGVEVLFQLKNDPATKDTHVVFLTNYGEPQKDTTWIDEKFAREAGAVDYIKKSEDLDAVSDQVKETLFQLSR